MSPATGLRPGLRATCPDCLRAACVCACLRRPGVPLTAAVQLLILQHPREQREAKGTARLLHQAVAGSQLLVGAAWPEPLPAVGNVGLARRDLLLYPATPGDAALPAPPPLDAAWRKSRRMLYDSPALQCLPRLALSAPPPSRYRIRRARGEGQLSTFEAALQTLAQLGSPPAQLAPLWAVFEAFVETLLRQGVGLSAARRAVDSTA